MEKPFYGRTGLLTEIGFVTDRIVSSNTSLVERTEENVIAKLVEEEIPNQTKFAKQALKWQPTLLMLPQTLLDYFLHVDEAILIDDDEFGVDVSLANYLRLSCITEILWKVQNATRAEERKIYCVHVFRWFNAHRPQLREIKNVLEGKLSWYVPSYDLVTFHDGKEVYRRRNISHRAVTLIGKDESVNHYVLRHNGCSSQHAVMHVNFVFTYEEKLMSYIEEYFLHHRNNNGKLTHSNNDHSIDDRDCNTETRNDDPNIFEWNANQAKDIVSCAWNALINLEQTGDVQHDANILKETGQKEPAKCLSANKFAELWSVELMITDLASTNGTIVEGERLTPFTPFRLIEGDHISFVGSPFTYMIAHSMTELS